MPDLVDCHKTFVICHFRHRPDWRCSAYLRCYLTTSRLNAPSFFIVETRRDECCFGRVNDTTSRLFYAPSFFLSVLEDDAILDTGCTGQQRRNSDMLSEPLVTVDKKYRKPLMTINTATERE